MIERSGNLIVISGPSGVGKSTLVKKAREVLPDLEFSVSCTTRAPRAGEVDGRDYFFLNETEFEKKVQQNEFIEFAGVFAHRYGTLKSEVLSRLQRGADVILDIDVQGAKQIRQAARNDSEIARAAQFIMIVPPDMETLSRRLTGRNSETPESLKLRLAGAQSELSNFRIYDYLVVNDDLETAQNDLISLLKTMRMRSSLVKGEPFA
ncbi:MAG: guanylate kinase [Lentisphaerae bacterium]|nr:guanylate kinase [Lentisphaerota bacterium]